MKTRRSATTKMLLASAERTLSAQYTPRIVKCLGRLSDGQIWWRPNEASNSAGNIVLHLCGNIRQWIVSGLGGERDIRQRDLEFSERGPVPRAEITSLLRRTVNEACKILRKMDDSSLSRGYVIQGFHVTGFEAVYHVAEHFSYHAGQIILLTKQLEGRDLRFTTLPNPKGKPSSVKP